MIASLAAMESIATGQPGLDQTESNDVAEGQKVIREQAQKLLSAFIAKEAAALDKGHSSDDVVVYEAYRRLVLDFLSSFESMGSTHLRHLDWLNPVLLSWCTRSKFEPIQKAVHDLLEKTSPASPKTSAPETEPDKSAPEPEPEIDN